MSDKDPIQEMVNAMISAEENQDAEPVKEESQAEETDVEETGEAVEESEVAEPDDDKPVFTKKQWDREISDKVKLRHQRKELREENAKLKAELESLKKPKAPDIDDFDDPEDFEKALEQYEKQEKGKPVSDASFEVAKSAILEQHSDWEDAPEDWNEVVTRSVADGGVPFTIEMVKMLADLDNGAQVMYHLATNKDEFNKVNSKLTDAARIRQLEKLSESLQGGTVPVKEDNKMNLTRPQKTVAAIDPVGGGNKGGSSLESLSVADHLAALRTRPRF